MCFVTGSRIRYFDFSTKEDLTVRTEHSLEILKERFEKLVLHRHESTTLSEAHRRRIADRFASKSLQELHEIVQQLDEIPSAPRP